MADLDILTNQARKNYHDPKIQNQFFATYKVKHDDVEKKIDGKKACTVFFKYCICCVTGGSFFGDTEAEIARKWAVIRKQRNKLLSHVVKPGDSEKKRIQEDDEKIWKNSTQSKLNFLK